MTVTHQHPGEGSSDFSMTTGNNNSHMGNNRSVAGGIPAAAKLGSVSDQLRRGASLGVRRRRAVVVAAVILATAIGIGAVVAGTVSGGTEAAPSASAPVTSEPAEVPAIPAQPARPAPEATPAPAPAPTFDSSANSIDDPTSIWVVVNKTRPLNPVDFIPGDLVEVPVPFANPPRMRVEASDATIALFAAFTAETGLELQSQSAYRDFAAQTRIYDLDIASLGQAGADLSTARPGTSEHQTGLTTDISALPGQCSLSACFGDTPHGQWLALNAWRFGFLLRYPADKVQVTGYEYEPWHYRYVGTELSEELHSTGVTTLEEFFGLPAAPAYP
jgi:D-alanyl-D-alanine carboxypeptidase